MVSTGDLIESANIEYEFVQALLQETSVDFDTYTVLSQTQPCIFCKTELSLCVHNQDTNLLRLVDKGAKIPHKCKLMPSHPARVAVHRYNCKPLLHVATQQLSIWTRLSTPMQMITGTFLCFNSERPTI